jgi:hypothetical protein
MKLLCIVALGGLLVACEHEASQRPAGTSPGSYAAAEGTCPANCSAPAATPQSFASDGEAGAALVGVWRICADAASLFFRAPADTIGVEFAPSQAEWTYDAASGIGNLYFLTQGPSGPLRGVGFEYQQTYEIRDGELLCHGYPGSSFWAAYSPCPQQWQLDSGGETALLVPF